MVSPSVAELSLRLGFPIVTAPRKEAGGDEAPVLWPSDAKSRFVGKDSDAEKIEGRRRRGSQRMRWLDGIINSMGMSLSSSRRW